MICTSKEVRAYAKKLIELYGLPVFKDESHGFNVKNLDDFEKEKFSLLILREQNFEEITEAAFCNENKVNSAISNSLNNSETENKLILAETILQSISNYFELTMQDTIDDVSQDMNSESKFDYFLSDDWKYKTEHVFSSN